MIDLKQEISRFRGFPIWRQWVIGGIIIFGLIYGAWSLWGMRPQTPSQGFVPTRPAIAAAKEPGPVIKAPLRIVPKKRVAQKFPQAPIATQEEWIDTADVPATPNGATVLTKIDTQTGEASSLVQVKPAPWFAFERGNTLGAGYEVGTQGGRIPVYYRRDILRVKDLHLVGEVGAKIALDPTEKSEAHAAVLAEWRF